MPQIVYNQVDAQNLEIGKWSVFVEDYDENGDVSYSDIADFDTFISFDGKHESQIVENAIEQGSFRSVNKIRKPNKCVIELGKGGANVGGGDVDTAIELVLENLKKYAKSTHLIVVQTPFGVFENMNLVSLDYSFKTGDCVNMLIAKLTLQEVQTSDSVLEYSSLSVKNPDDENNVDVGEAVLKEV